MLMSLSLQPVVALVAGILILVMPRLLNYIVAIYLIAIGLLVEYLGRVYEEVKRRPLYVVGERLGVERDGAPFP